jgi:trimethylamine---corrinoid protein Co-methyltransferase
MELKSKFLSDEERTIIHKDSIKILEEIGIKFSSENALALLEKEGARIDWDREIAYIPEKLVKKALSSAPKSFVLGARNQDNNFQMPSTFTGYNLDGTGVNTIDFNTGKRRTSVLKDVAQSARIFDEIDLGCVLWPPISPCDVPYGPRNIFGTGTAFINTSKHVSDEVKEMREVKYVVEMLKAITGNVEEVKNRKIYSVTYCTVAPLCHDGEMLDANIELTKYQIPILIYPMPACGTTGPASLYSNVAMANAEALSALVIFQAATPGTPLIYGAALGVVHPKSGMFLEGTPETILQIGAMGDMARYYGLPNMSAGCLTDAKSPGMQSVMEKIITTMPLVLSGTDIVQGIGLVESSMTLSYEQIVIDGEIAKLCKRLKDGIDISPEKDYYEDIKQVGHGGHFLKQKNTRQAFRSSEFYMSEICDRNSHDEWELLGNPDLLSNARKKVEEILNGEQNCPLSEDKEKLLLEIMDEAKQVLV